LSRFAGLEVPILRDLPSPAMSRGSLLISRFSVRFRVGPLDLRDRRGAGIDALARIWRSTACRLK